MHGLFEKGRAFDSEMKNNDMINSGIISGRERRKLALIGFELALFWVKIGFVWIRIGFVLGSFLPSVQVDLFSYSIVNTLLTFI